MVSGPFPSISTAPLAPQWTGDPNTYIGIATTQLNLTNAYVTQLGGLAASLTPPVISPEFATGPSAPAQITAEQPEFQQIVWVAPNAPAAFTEVLDTTALFPEPFDEAPPEVSFGPAPAAFSETAPDSPAVNLTFEDPTLTVELPSPPNLLSINVSSFSGLNLPTIDPDAIPELDVVAPSIREYVPGALYTSALLTSLRTSLQDRIDNGGTGLNADVENAIWDRGREREARARADALKALDEMEAMGFALPPGAYLDARLKITTESEYVERGLSREIMIKQAELEQSNVLAALQTANALEGQLMNYTNAVEQRLFESCKYATEAGISIFNARVQAYAAYLDAYKTKVMIYEAQIRAEIARVDAYKAEIEAETAKAQVNTALVEQYKVQADVALSSIRIYEARIAAIKTKAEIEQTKVAVYGEQIKAYVAKINAYTAGVEGYRASLEAEKTKQQVFQSQVEAFSAQVGAAAKQADSQIAEYQGKIAAKTAELEGYKATIQAETARVNATVAYNTVLSDSFKSEVTAITSFNETLTKQWQVAVDQAQRTSEIGVSAAKANAELYISTRGIAMDAAKTGAQVSSQLGASALNAVHWSSSFSNSNAFGISTSSSTSNSYSGSESYNENYNYSASV